MYGGVNIISCLDKSISIWNVDFYLSEARGNVKLSSDTEYKFMSSVEIFTFDLGSSYRILVKAKPQLSEKCPILHRSLSMPSFSRRVICHYSSLNRTVSGQRKISQQLHATKQPLILINVYAAK